MTRNERFLLYAILADVMGSLITVSSGYFLFLFGDDIGVENASEMDLELLNFSRFVNVLELLPVALVCACWLFSLSKANHRNIYLWTFAGFAINIFAVLFFFLLMLYQSTQQPAHAADTGHELS